MKNFINFFRNYIGVVYATIILVCTSLGMLFGYMYGSTDSRVSQYSSIVSADLRAKDQDLRFLHGYVEYTEKMKPIDKYNNNLSLQQKTIYRYRYYNSYLLSTMNKKVCEFDTKINFSSSEKKINLPNTRLAMVRNYWDNSYMESIGIPLFHINESENKSNISSKNPDVDYGCYISSTSAYEIAIEMELLKKGDTDQTHIKSAFNTLISSPLSFYLSLNGSKGEKTFTINNIYIDSPQFLKILTEDQQYISSHHFGDYCYHFAKYNKNTIFTHAQDLFSDECLLYFDIVESTSNISLFFDNVMGKDYVANHMNIKLDTGFKDIDSLSDSINKAYSLNEKGKIVYIFLSFFVFELSIFIQSNYISLRNNKRHSWMFKLILPSLPFIGLWLFLTVFIMAKNNAANLFFTFNYIGNMISVLFLLTITIFSIILKLFGDDDEKLFIK